MGEQVEDGDLFAQAARELRDDLHDFGGEGELAKLDGPKHQHIGDGLGGREDAEHRVQGQRLGPRAAFIADGDLEGDLAGASDLDHRAVVAALDDVVPDHRLDVVQPILPPAPAAHACLPDVGSVGGGDAAVDVQHRAVDEVRLAAEQEGDGVVDVALAAEPAQRDGARAPLVLRRIVQA